MLGVSPDQLHFIRVMDHLMVVECYTFSLMCWPIVIHLDHLQSIFVFKSAKVIFRVLGLIRSRVSSIKSCKCSIKVNRCMRRSNKVSTTIISIITCSVIDFSSKTCFEEKQSFYVFMYKFDVISFFLICNNLNGDPGHLFKPLQLHHLQGEQKFKAFSSLKAKIKKTAQKQSFKSKLKANIRRVGFL